MKCLTRLLRRRIKETALPEPEAAAGHLPGHGRSPDDPQWFRTPGKQSSGLFSVRNGRQTWSKAQYDKSLGDLIAKMGIGADG